MIDLVLGRNMIVGRVQKMSIFSATCLRKFELVSHITPPVLSKFSPVTSGHQSVRPQYDDISV